MDKKMETGNAIYDKVFHTLIYDCTELMIPVVNEAFGECYTGREKISFMNESHIIHEAEGTLSERFTDTSFIIKGDKEKKYHWECQSTQDSSMLVRIFEYDTQIALEDNEIADGVMTVEFPNSAILYLRSTKNTPDNMTICIRTSGGNVSYDIPVMKIKNYAIDEIFSKRLYFLIPFYIFTHESRFQVYNKNGSEIEVLRREYAEICSRLEAICAAGEITEFVLRTILETSEMVLNQIARHYENVQKEVRSAMLGPAIQTMARTILDEGIQIGREQGREQGRNQILISLVKDGKISIDEAAGYGGISVAEFTEHLADTPFTPSS